MDLSKYELDEVIIPTNKYQTPVTRRLLETLDSESQDKLYEDLTTIEFIKNLISPNRPLCKDLPRDERGRAIIDVTNPPIIENTDYFRQRALFYQKNNCYTFLRPNNNPNSEYRKFWDEEIRRCREGYLRESDGAWISGINYWFLNYQPMLVNIVRKSGGKAADRVEGFPFFHEGDSWRFNYLDSARESGQHAIELAKRGCAKSYSLSAIAGRNLILGETEIAHKRNITVITAYLSEYLKVDGDGTLNKFVPTINFIFANTPWPHLLLKNSSNVMSWRMGYKDEYGVEKGTLNQVMAVSAKDDADKLRGKRGWILFEEMGTFRNLLSLYNTTRRSVEEGNKTFACMYLVGTANDNESDFSSAKTLLYNTKGFNINTLPNVYDRPKEGRPTFGFFYPAYVNRKDCCNTDGVSDIVAALVEIYKARADARTTGDPSTVLRVIAEDPITPAEAIIKVKNAYFPVPQLQERLTRLDSDPKAYDDVYIGNLVLDNKGEVVFKTTNDSPIRQWKTDNSVKGAIEIFEMPEKDSSGKVFANRYILGNDPVDNDQAESNSFSSTFVLDLFTDRIVAEYTGRQLFADDNYEIARLLCMFYNGILLFEAHAYSEKVPTPDGFKEWKDIKIGDTLFSPTKGTVKVIDIPVDTYMPIYKVTLVDGRVITASDRHIWSVYYKNSKTLQNLTTEQLMHRQLKNAYGQHSIFIPEPRVTEYERKELPIYPYVMGLILSEGSIRGAHCTKNNIQISSNEEDMKVYQRHMPYSCKHIGSKGYSWHIKIPNCRKIMEELGLYNTDSHTKFIPDMYLYCDMVQRMELLMGLMDGDGCATVKGAPVFTTVSKQLAENVASLARSLGMKAWIRNGSNNSFRVSIASQYKIFKLPRKIVEQHTYTPYKKGSKASAILYKTAIDKIEFSHYERGKCVTVDSEDGLYLINDYVITHNSNKKGIYAYFKKMNSTHLLSETPEFLREKQMIKYSAFGSNAYGVNANATINNYANQLIRDWLLKPVESITENGDIVTSANLYHIRNRALLEELIGFNPEVNVDRIRALGMAMLLREQRIITYGGNLNTAYEESVGKDYLGKDDFFTRNFKPASESFFPKN